MFPNPVSAIDTANLSGILPWIPGINEGEGRAERNICLGKTALDYILVWWHWLSYLHILPEDFPPLVCYLHQVPFGVLCTSFLGCHYQDYVILRVSWKKIHRILGVRRTFVNLSSNFILLCLGFLMRHGDNNKMLISYGVQWDYTFKEFSRIYGKW